MPTIFSTVKKYRFQRSGVMLRFVDGEYHYDKENEYYVMRLLKTVSPRETILTDQEGKQINIEKPVFTVIKSQKPKAKKSKRRTQNADSNN